MVKEGYTKLRIVLPDSDVEGLRHLAKENQHPDGVSGIAAELIQQGLGKRKLGDYIHVEAHEQSVASKDRMIAGLKKKSTEIAEIWNSVVVALGMQEDLRESIKDIPGWCLDRVRFILDLETAATEKNEAYEKQIAELQETTLLRTEHEARVNEISKGKMEVETQLKTVQESLAESKSKVSSLETEKGQQTGTIESLQRQLTGEIEKSWFHKLWETLTGREIETNSPVNTEASGEDDVHG